MQKIPTKSYEGAPGHKFTVKFPISRKFALAALWDTGVKILAGVSAIYAATHMTASGSPYSFAANLMITSVVVVIVWNTVHAYKKARASGYEWAVSWYLLQSFFKESGNLDGLEAMEKIARHRPNNLEEKNRELRRDLAKARSRNRLQKAEISRIRGLFRLEEE